MFFDRFILAWAHEFRRTTYIPPRPPSPYSPPASLVRAGRVILRAGYTARRPPHSLRRKFPPPTGIISPYIRSLTFHRDRPPLPSCSCISTAQALKPYAGTPCRLPLGFSASTWLRPRYADLPRDFGASGMVAGAFPRWFDDVTVAVAAVSDADLRGQYRRSIFSLRARSLDACMVLMFPMETSGSAAASASAAGAADFSTPPPGRLPGAPAPVPPFAPPFVIPCFSSSEALPSLVCSNKGHGPTPAGLSLQPFSSPPPPPPPPPLPPPLLPPLRRLVRGTEASP